MNLIRLFKKIAPFVKPYKWLVVITLILTLIGSGIAQVNAIVLDRTVDAVNALIGAADFSWAKAARMFLKNPPIIFLDEPTASLDAVATEQSGDPDEVYRQGGIYKDIVDASARSLNVEKLAKIVDDDPLT